MYELCVRPLVQTIQVFDSEQGQSAKGVTPYCTEMLLTDLSMGECRIHFVLGVLNDEINRLVAAECIRQKFEQVQLEVPTGKPATRYAKFVRTAHGLDRYVVDLTKVK